MLHRAIEKCGRDIVLSLSPGPALVEENEFYHENANMWRITDDLWDNWESLRDMFDRCHNWQGLTRGGGYPDCDMLPFGMIGKGFGDERKSALTYDEQKTMMTLWCIFQSPLMLGAELTKLDEETLSLLCNQKVLALFELPAGQAKEIIRDDTVIVWKKGDYVAIFNVSGFDCMVNISELLEIQEKEFANDLWTGEKIQTNQKTAISAHGCVLLEI